MLAILSLIPTWLKIGVLALAGAALLVWASYTAGKHEGRQQAAVAAVKQTAEAYQKRARTNETINSLDPVALCVELGGVQSDCEQQLRGLGENTR